MRPSNIIGNGKRHRTPLPRSLRKIKRVSVNVFLSLKELLYSVKVNRTITPGVIEKNLFLNVNGGFMSLLKPERMNMSQAQAFILTVPSGIGGAYPNGTGISITKNKNKGTHDNLIQFSYRPRKETVICAHIHGIRLCD